MSHYLISRIYKSKIPGHPGSAASIAFVKGYILALEDMIDDLKQGDYDQFLTLEAWIKNMLDQATRTLTILLDLNEKEETDDPSDHRLPRLGRQDSRGQDQHDPGNPPSPL